MTDVNGDGVADAVGWHDRGVEALLCSDLGSGTAWTQIETLGLGHGLGWGDVQFSSTIQWAELDGEASNGNEMLIRGSSGVRVYDLDSAGAALADFREDYPTFTDEEADAYDYILSELRSGDALLGYPALLGSDYDLREIYGNIGNDNWSEFASFIAAMQRPSGVSADAWDNVVTQLSLEINTVANVQNACFDAREALFDDIYALCSDKISEVVTNVEEGTESLDNQYAEWLVNNFIQGVGTAGTMVAGAQVEALAAKVLVQVAVTTATAAIRSAADSALYSDPNLSSTDKLEIAGSDIQGTLDDWFTNNKARFSDLYADMVSTMAGLNSANQTVVAAGGSLVDVYDQAADGIVDAFELWLYQTLMPVEYTLAYTNEGNAEGDYLYTGAPDPPDYDMYCNGELSSGNYKWTWA